MKLHPLFLPLAAVSLLALPVRAASADWPLPASDPAAQHVSAERLAVAHTALNKYVDDGLYAGYIAYFARNGTVVDWYAHGWQDIEAKKPMQKDSIVRIYSMSKVITSVAILTLMEDGKLKLSDPISTYLPALKDRQILTGGTADAPQLAPTKNPITILHLLTHTSGYYYDAEYSAHNEVASELFRRVKPWEAASLDDFVQRIAKLPVLDEPGVRFRYAISMDLLGAIVEKVSGQRFSRYLQDRIFAPLGMRDTAFWVPAEKESRLARIYRQDESGKLVAQPPLHAGTPKPDGTGLESGGGGLYSTAADYARFAQMLLNNGQLDGARILSRKTVDLMRHSHIDHLEFPHPFDRVDRGYGLGVQVVNDLGRSTTLGSVGMWGWDGAATTVVWIDPKENSVAILLTQRLPFNAHDIFSTFLDTYYSSLTD
jgi:CubicO group peptidase (beta-lactamase class C family)